MYSEKETALTVSLISVKSADGFYGFLNCRFERREISR